MILITTNPRLSESRIMFMHTPKTPLTLMMHYTTPRFQKKVLYKLMPQPLKPELLPLEQYLLPDLPTIVGNVDYQTLRAQLLRMHQLLVEGGIERDFIARSVSHRRQLAVKRYQKSGKYERIVREHSARALRCNLARVL